MKTVLITGIFGQDGSYLAEFVLAKGYQVVGIARASDMPVLTLIDKIKVVECDILSQAAISDILLDFKPVEVYNYAAYSSGEGMFDDAVSIGQINGLAVTCFLEAIHQVDSKIRFCQASSSEMFGEPVEMPQSEKTPFNPRSPYGAAKLYAHSMINIYRKRYGQFACSAILFNHESPRRGLGFVTRKIVHQAVKIKLGLAKELGLGNLDARRDWGFAGDYIRAMWLMLQQPGPDDYVIASGQTHSVRELCEIAFGHLGLDYRNYLRQDPAAFRPDESVQLVGSIEKAKKQLGWTPQVDFSELVRMMVDADLGKIIEQDNVKTDE